MEEGAVTVVLVMRQVLEAALEVCEPRVPEGCGRQDGVNGCGCGIRGEDVGT